MGRRPIFRAKAGEWNETDKVGRNVYALRSICCDCNLTHLFNYKVVKGRLYIAAWRDNRTTAALRRHRKH